MGIKLQVPNRTPEDTDVLLPIMSLLLILIPVLVGNMAFYHLHAVSINTPGVSDAPPSDAAPPQKSEMKVMLKLNITDILFNIELLNENSGEVIHKKGIERGRTGLVYLRKELAQLVKEYPKLDVVMLSSHKNLKYGDLLSILDEGINAVSRGGIDNKPALKIVMIPGEI